MGPNQDHPYLSNRESTFFSPLATKAVPSEHPRLFGPRQRLQTLAKERPHAYQRMKDIAGRELSGQGAPPWDSRIDFGSHVSIASKLWSMSLVAAIEQDAVMGRKAVELAFEHFMSKPAQVGHSTFGQDAGNVAVVYDMCHPWWTDDEKKIFHDYLFECRDKNVDEEISVFHAGWWGWKSSGLILAALAVIGETQRELYMLYLIDREYRLVAAEALKLCGEGGSHAEGFYAHGWPGSWNISMEAMRFCMGADYYALALEHYHERAVASMFEHYPTVRERGSRRFACLGDGRGRFFKTDRDLSMTGDRILVSHFRDDPANQAVNAWLNQTPHPGADESAYREFLFFDPTVKQANLKKFRLSHAAKAAGYVYARSSWEEDATYLLFRCGKRFTSHQHLDVGHFLIFKHEELAADGGEYVSFHDSHGVNYYSRTIAHNTVLVHHPDEVFEQIRGYIGKCANDGGQAYPWPGTCFWHNGDGGDPDKWRAHPELGDIADLLAYRDTGAFVYMAGDCTRAYWKGKLEHFTRQIVYVRPGTFVIFDRVKSTDPSFKKTWLLQATQIPEQRDGKLVITNGKGRLFVQTLLPAQANVKLNHGDELYRYGGEDYTPQFTYGPGVVCRVEISPKVPSKQDFFLHVLTATDSDVEKVANATALLKNGKVTVTVGKVAIEFLTEKLGGSVTIKGKKQRMAGRVMPSGAK